MNIGSFTITDMLPSAKLPAAQQSALSAKFAGLINEWDSAESPTVNSVEIPGAQQNMQPAFQSNGDTSIVAAFPQTLPALQNAVAAYAPSAPNPEAPKEQNAVTANAPSLPIKIMSQSTWTQAVPAEAPKLNEDSKVPDVESNCEANEILSGLAPRHVPTGHALQSNKAGNVADTEPDGEATEILSGLAPRHVPTGHALQSNKAGNVADTEPDGEATEILSGLAPRHVPTGHAFQSNKAGNVADTEPDGEATEILSGLAPRHVPTGHESKSDEASKVADAKSDDEAVDILTCPAPLPAAADQFSAANIPVPTSDIKPSELKLAQKDFVALPTAVPVSPQLQARATRTTKSDDSSGPALPAGDSPPSTAIALARTEHVTGVKQVQKAGVDQTVTPSAFELLTRSARADTAEIPTIASPAPLTIVQSLPTTSTGINPEVPVTAHIDMASDTLWLDQLAREIVAVGSQNGKLRFSLSPEALGELKVEITTHRDGVNIQLQTSTESAARIFTAEQPKLVEDLRQSGVKLVSTDLLGGQHMGGTRDHSQPQSFARDLPLRTSGSPPSDDSPEPSTTAPLHGRFA